MNPYFSILTAPLVAFLILVAIKVPSDPINVLCRVYVFALFGYVGARYVGRTPALIVDGNVAPEARNITGWALVVIGSMLTQIYSVLYIWYDRPIWMSSTYWSPAFVILIGTGLTLVASSVPKLPPFGNGPQGLSTFASFMLGALCTAGLFFMQHLPMLWNALKSLLVGATHAF